MKTLKSLAILFCVGLFLLSTRIRADQWNKETKITFSGPVQVADTQLPAGTYVFKLADLPVNRHVVQIFNEDQTQVIATILAVPDYSFTPADNTVVKFAETSEGSEASGTLPETGIPIKEWFHPGDNWGQEFPVTSQPQVAAIQPEPVAEPAAAPEPPPAPPEAAAPAPAEPAAPEAPAETPQAAPTESTPEQPAAPEQLPQTASQMPLLALMGIVSLAAAASFRFILKRWA